MSDRTLQAPRRGALGVGLLLVAVVGCDEDSPTAPTLPTAFTLSGVVTTAGSADPVGGASVRVTGGPQAGRSAVTGGDGAYSLSGLSGTLTVQVSREGFTPQERTLSLTADVRVDFSLERFRAAVRGRVTDFFGGNGVPAAKVEIPGTASTQTDGSGAYELQVEGSGAARLVLEKTSHWTRDSHVLLNGGSAADLDLIPRDGAFDMTFFDHLFRWKGERGTRRWLEQPTFEIWTRKFTCLDAGGGESCIRMRATDLPAGSAFEGNVRNILAADVGPLTGDFLSGAPIRTRDHAPGTVVTDTEMFRQGTITISLVDTGFTDLSWSRWQFAGEGELRTGHIQMNTRHEGLPCLYSHELAHAFGYRHPDGQFEVPRASVMRCDRVTGDDRLHARVLYRRPPGSRTPDEDPGSFVLGMARATAGGPVRGPLVTEEAH